jgi:hypothetical protein
MQKKIVDEEMLPTCKGRSIASIIVADEGYHGFWGGLVARAERCATATRPGAVEAD